MHNPKYTGLKASLEQKISSVNIVSEVYELDESIFFLYSYAHFIL